MKICAWNIRQGGSTRIKNIVETIFEHDADIVILTEFRIAKGNLIQSACIFRSLNTAFPSKIGQVNGEIRPCLRLRRPSAFFNKFLL